MGQIKNIKLHIVTDIKLSIIQSIIKMAVREEREGIIYDNPEKFYDIEASEIGFGKMAKVAVAKSKTDGKTYAAKMIYFDDDVAFIIGELCETLNFLHQQNIVHLDLRPTNIRFEGRDIKLPDFNSSRHLANKKAGAVVDVIGDTEFCAPEMLNFDPVLPASDMWSVAIIAYLLLSGVSPFFYEDKAEVLKSVQGVKYTFCEAFDEISTEAKDFIKKCLLRAPEMRMTAEDALKHPWLSSEMTSKRKAISLLQTALDTMEETDARLLSEEEEDYVEASFVFRTFEEEEYESPEEESDEE